MSETITLISSDGINFNANRNAMCLSPVIKELLKTQSEIHLRTIDAETLSAIIHWCQNHINDGIELPPWQMDANRLIDMDLLIMPEEKFKKVINAAYILNLERLIITADIRLANLVKDMNSGEILSFIGIENEISTDL
uniref:SKP1 component POZ domain-containing protein n=1 Tax=Panagrolaimus sp. PS1159 TaxID=55785 RepID=A0AC35G0N2_9BILA